MNLNSLAQPLCATIVPTITGKWKASTGYTTSADGTRLPTYAAPVAVTLMVQPLSTADIKQLDAMNIQGVTRTVFIGQDARGIDRPNSRGGDLLSFNGRTWLVTAVMEPWGTWSKVGVTEQLEAAF